ncbi:MAG TPA: protein kinase [Myxococcaceae bacterium]|nr:protein kinase [Myxococcaceae bacterium]
MSLAATNNPVQQFGKYRLLKKLAQGGMAEIFLAVQHGPHAFEKVVVIKRMLPELCVSFDFVQMFLDEARVAARLDHPNIIRIYDFGDFEGQYYLAMEYIPGEDLASIIQQCKRTRAKIPVELVLDLMISAAEGLHHAHEMEDGQGNSLGIVHRDVSPSNIICGYQGAVKVLDFGVARAKNNISKTSPGVRKGTPQYLAPEQALGESVDRRADIFALGLVMHELLTGNRLFQRENEHATISAIIGDDIVPPSLWRPELPVEIDRVVMKAMSRTPDGRYPSALEMAADMSAYLAGTDYLRGTGQVEFLTSAFGDERKREKLRLALGVNPEELVDGPNLAPVRDTGAVPLPAPRPTTGPGRPSDRPGSSPGASSPSTGGSGPKRGVAAAPATPARRSNPQMAARRSNPQLVAPSIAPLVPPIEPVLAPAGSAAPAAHKPLDNGATRPITPPGAKAAPSPAPSPARPSKPHVALTVDELFSDLGDLATSGPLRTPSPPAATHTPAPPAPVRTPPPARGAPPRAEAPRSPPAASDPLWSAPPPSAPAAANPFTAAPATSDPLWSAPPPSAPVAANPFAVAPARSEPIRSEPVRSEPPPSAPVAANPFAAAPARSEPVRPEQVQAPAPASTVSPPAPATRRKSPLPLVAAAGLGVVVIGAVLFFVGKGGSGTQQTQPTPPTEVKAPPTEVKQPPTEVKTPPTEVKTPPTEVKTPPTEVKTPPPPTGLQVGGLKLMNIPAGATATLDGDAISDPSKERYFPAGPHVLVVEAKGFLPFKADIEVVVGQVKQVDATLKPQPTVPKGTVEINCQPWCQITVDKKDTGKTSPAKLSLTVGSHTLLLANPPAGLAKTITVVVPEGGTVTKVVNLEE